MKWIAINIMRLQTYVCAHNWIIGGITMQTGIFLLILFSSVGTFYGQRPIDRDLNWSITMGFCPEVKSKQIIIENRLFSPKMRHIEVFMDEKSFSKEQLTALFRCLSLQHPNPQSLTVEVFTDWSQLSGSGTPIEAITNQPIDADEFKHKKAIYYRVVRDMGTKRIEYFEYLEKLGDTTYKTVNLLR